MKSIISIKSTAVKAKLTHFLVVSDATPGLRVSAKEVPSPVSGTQSQMSQYQYSSSQRSVSPAAPRRQPPPTLPKPTLPASVALQDAATFTNDQPPPGTTINYHIYNYGSSEVTGLQTDSGLGTLERGGERSEGGGGWQEDSLDRRVTTERSASGRLAPSPSPGHSSGPLSHSSCPLPSSSGHLPGERLCTRSVTTQVERTAGQYATSGRVAASPAGERRERGETVQMMTQTQQRSAEIAPFPVDTTARDTTGGESPVHVPSNPQVRADGAG